MTLDLIWPELPQTRFTFRSGNYIWSFPWLIWTQMRHLGTFVPRFCTEFRYLSYGQSGLAWGAILRKVFVLIWFPTLPCSFFQEHVPRMHFSPKHCSQKGALKGGEWMVRSPVFPDSQVIRMSRSSVFPGSQVIKMDRVSVFPGSQVIKMICFSIFPGLQVTKMLRFQMFPGLPLTYLLPLQTFHIVTTAYR